MPLSKVERPQNLTTAMKSDELCLSHVISLLMPILIPIDTSNPAALDTSLEHLVEGGKGMFSMDLLIPFAVSSRALSHEAVVPKVLLPQQVNAHSNA